MDHAAFATTLSVLCVAARKREPKLTVTMICEMAGKLHAEEVARLTPKATKGDMAAASAIYEVYPKKVARPHALRAILKAMRGTPAPELLRLTTAFKEAVTGWPAEEMQYVPNPSTWFNQERFRDDPKTWERGVPKKVEAPTNYARF